MLLFMLNFSIDAHFMQDDEYARHNESNATIASEVEHRAGGQHFAQVNTPTSIIAMNQRKVLRHLLAHRLLLCKFTFLGSLCIHALPNHPSFFLLL